MSAVVPVSTSTTPTIAPTPAPATNSISPVTTLVCDDLSTPTGTPPICADGSSPGTNTDLGQDTSGLLPDDWDVEPWAPALFASCSSCGGGGRGDEQYTILPFSPSYFAHSPGFEVEEFSPAYFAAPTAGNLGEKMKQILCPHISQVPGKGAINCTNLWMVLLAGIGLVAVGVLTR